MNKKYQPKGITFLYEDKDIIVVNKASGLLTVSSNTVKDKTAYFLLDNYVKKGNSKSRKRVFVVHRLDKDTSGILIFAKNEIAKKYLQEKWKSFKKNYIAVIHGSLEKKSDTISSYLTENRAHNIYSIDDPKKGKLAKTAYKVIKESKKYSLLNINLLTGKKNQIRVHFSEANHPIVGDKKYGKDYKDKDRLALHSATLKISHPYTKKDIFFEAEMPKYFDLLLKS